MSIRRAHFLLACTCGLVLVLLAACQLPVSRRAPAPIGSSRATTELPGLFLADAETGDLSQWTAYAAASGNTIAATTAAAIHGTYGFQLDWAGSDGHLYAYKDLGSAYNSLYYRVYVLFHNITTNGVDTAQIALTASGNDYGTFTFYSRGPGQALGYAFKVNGQTVDNKSGQAIFAQDTAYCVEIHWQNETAGGTGHGGGEWWLNGVQQYSNLAIANGTGQAQRAWIGNNGLGLPASGNQVNFDDCQVSASYNGLYAAPAPLQPAQPAANVLTWHNDNARTGQYLGETVLAPSNVAAATFGKIGFLSVQGLVDAEPLFVSGLPVEGTTRNVVFVATEHDMVYAFDADSLAQVWQVSVAGSGETPSDDRGCSQVTPEIGVTATPVIDPSAGTDGVIFLVAMSKDGSGNYHQRLHALDLVTGAERPGSPVTISATSGTQVFDPKQYKERSALVLSNGVVYLAWASHCDATPYNGWIMGYAENSLAQVSVLDVTPNGTDGAVWMSGAGISIDAGGNLYLLDGNGTFDTTLDTSGRPAAGDYGNSFLKLTAGSGLAVADYFAPHNTAADNSADTDLGSGGALLLPDLQDATGTTRHLAIGAGKDGNIYVVNRDSMGGFNSTTDSAIYQEITGAFGHGVYAAPAWFQGTVYYGAVSDVLKAFSVVNALLNSSPSSQGSVAFAYPGATPSISANGSTGGIVWAVQNQGGTGVLHAYDAANLSSELYNSTQAGTRDTFMDNKFVTPMIAAGRVYVGTPTGVVVFGLLP